MSDDWRGYQEDAAKLFRSMGLDAEVDAKIKGVRTTHAIDVLVKSHHAGFDITWLVECKYWKTAVSKLHVLGLREIVNDTGADRGILLCEAGFQSGAIEAANLTNVQLTSLKTVNETAGTQISAMRLRELYDRAEICTKRYWDLDKDVRIKYGLRQDVGDYGYSGTNVIAVCNELLVRAFRFSYPFTLDSVQALVMYGPDKQFKDPEEVISTIATFIEDLEERLSKVPIS